MATSHYLNKWLHELLTNYVPLCPNVLKYLSKAAALCWMILIANFFAGISLVNLFFETAHQASDFIFR